MRNKNLLERAEREQSAMDESKAAHVKELRRLADADSARRAAEAAEQKRKDDAKQAERDKRFDDELTAEARSIFYSGNPGAPESLWKSMQDEMRKRVLLRRAEEADTRPHSLYRYIR